MDDEPLAPAPVAVREQSRPAAGTLLRRAVLTLVTALTLTTVLAGPGLAAPSQPPPSQPPPSQPPPTQPGPRPSTGAREPVARPVISAPSVPKPAGSGPANTGKLSTPPPSVELQTIYPTVPTGTAVTLTAVSSVDVGPTPYYIEIFDNNTGTLIARCGRGTTCTVSVRFDTPAAHRYIAYIAGYSATYPPAGIQSASVDAEPWVTWTSSDLRVGVSTSWGDPSQPYSVTATTNADVGPTPYYIEIFSEFRDPVTGLDNGFSLLAACSSGTTCPSGDVPAGTRVTAFVAPLVRSLPPGTVANSRTVLHGLIP